MKELRLTLTTIYILVVFCGAAAIVSPAQSLTLLHSFDGSDGSKPYGALVQAADGNFYGTTAYGSTVSGWTGFGKVFEITPSGSETTLHSFIKSDGATPYGALIQATDGNFYGTTLEGGGSQSCDRGCGTVFKMTPSGTLTTLHSFCAQSGCADGSAPFAGLIQATDGNFYGTTATGGANAIGTVFKITPSGTLTTLHSFEGTDGVYPEGPLVQATDGNFYGTTNQGGSGCVVGCGTIFKITPDGTLTTLHLFTYDEGQRSVAGLVQTSDGNFYGTTTEGGIGDCVEGCGTVFRITPDGTLTVLHLFTGPDGGDATGTLIQATDGSLYGTTYVRGTYNFGTIFKISMNGTFTVLHNFINRPTEGFYPYAGLIQARDGNFYGTTSYGGSDSYYGTVFRLVLPRSCSVCATAE